jgi:hypothetical protein
MHTTNFLSTVIVATDYESVGMRGTPMDKGLSCFVYFYLTDLHRRYILLMLFGLIFKEKEQKSEPMKINNFGKMCLDDVRTGIKDQLEEE